MMRLLIILLSALSLFMLCSCSDPSVTGNLSYSEVDSISEPIPDINTKYLLNNEENARAWEQSDESEWQTFTEDFDGLVITVTTDKSEYGLDEPIKVRATLQNKTGKDI